VFYSNPLWTTVLDSGKEWTLLIAFTREFMSTKNPWSLLLATPWPCLPSLWEEGIAFLSMSQLFPHHRGPPGLDRIILCSHPSGTNTNQCYDPSSWFKWPVKAGSKKGEMPLASRSQTVTCSWGLLVSWRASKFLMGLLLLALEEGTVTTGFMTS
jgi:hypothetical protein